MTISDAFAQDLLDLVFNATAIADIAENDTTSPSANVYLSLHYDDPGETGTQTTNEASYTSYDRVAKLRQNATGGFKPAALNTDMETTFFGTEVCDFPESTGAEPNGGGILDWFAVGHSDLPTAGLIFWSGGVSPTITVAGSGVTPRLTNATTITLDANWLSVLVSLALMAKLGLLALLG